MDQQGTDPTATGKMRSNADIGPKPGESVPSSRWAVPFRTLLDHTYLWAIALRQDRPLSTRQRLAGCASVVYADTYDALMELTIQHDRLAELVAAFPSAEMETASEPPRNTGREEGGA